MIKFLRVLPVLLLLAMMNISAISAQEAELELISYDEVVTGEMTADEYNFDYAFTGEAGDVVIVSFKPVDTFGELDSPILSVTDSNGYVLADTSDFFVFGSVELVVELLSDDIFNLNVTREDGAKGTSVGEFTVELKTATVLSAEDVVSNTLIAEALQPQYYVIRPETEFGVLFVRESGNIEVEVSIIELNKDSMYISSADRLGSVTGTELTEAALGIFSPDRTYIVLVQEEAFSFNWEPEDTAYTLELLDFE